MKAWTSLAAVALFSTAFAPLPSATADETAPPRYRHYAGCGIDPDQTPSHSCPKRGKKGAFFRSLDASVTYRVCVTFPDDRRLCASQQHARKGELKVNTIRSHLVGRHIVSWYVAGTRVGTYAFRIRP
jgi:hypothetical protein